MVEVGRGWKSCVEKASDFKFGTNVNQQMYFQETTNWCPCHYIFADISIFLFTKNNCIDENNIQFQNNLIKVWLIISDFCFQCL